MFKDLLKQGRFYWVSLTVTAVAAYGFKLINGSVGFEELNLSNYVDGKIYIGQGRWGTGMFGSPLLQGIFNTYLILPFWRLFLALVLLVIAVTIIGGLLKKYAGGRFDDRAAAIFACVLVSFPYMGEYYYINETNLTASFVFLYTALSLHFFAAWVFDRKHPINGLWAAFFLAYGAAHLEYALFFFLIFGFALFLVREMHREGEKERLRDIVQMLTKMLVTLLAGLGIWKAVGFTIQKIAGVGTGSYTSAHMRYDVDSPLELLKAVVKFLLAFPQAYFSRLAEAKNNIYAISDRAIFLAALILIGFGVFGLVKQKRVAALLYALLTIGSAYGMYVMIGTVSLLDRLMLVFAPLPAVAFALAYAAAPGKLAKTRLSPRLFVLIFSIWIVFTQTRDINRLFDIDYKKYRSDVYVMETIFHDLGGLGTQKPIVFIGFAPGVAYSDESTIVISNLNFRRFGGDPETNPGYIHRFFTYHGLPIRAADPRSLDLDVIRAQIDGMSNWPQDGYIREFDEYVIVKLGLSSLEERPQLVGDPITADTEVLQTFRLSDCELAGVSIYFVTHGNVYSSTLYVEFGGIDESGSREALANLTILASAIGHNDMPKMNFSQRVAVTEGEYYLRLTSDAKEGDALSAWYLGGADEDMAGKLYVGNVVREAEMIFELHMAGGRSLVDPQVEGWRNRGWDTITHLFRK